MMKMMQLCGKDGRRYRSFVIRNGVENPAVWRKDDYIVAKWYLNDNDVAVYCGVVIMMWLMTKNDDVGAVW